MSTGKIRFSSGNNRKKSKTARGKMERVTGIEPALLAWKARALPLSYTRLSLIQSDDEQKNKGSVIRFGPKNQAKEENKMGWYGKNTRKNCDLN